jgi:mRNA interferase RelE/StbE
MLYYDKEIKKSIKKGHLPKEIAELFHHAFIALDTTHDLNLFDIKKLVSRDNVDYFRLRKGKYRAIFTYENNDFHILDIMKREEVYKKWP